MAKKCVFVISAILLIGMTVTTSQNIAFSQTSQNTSMQKGFSSSVAQAEGVEAKIAVVKSEEDWKPLQEQISSSPGTNMSVSIYDMAEDTSEAVVAVDRGILEKQIDRTIKEELSDKNTITVVESLFKDGLTHYDLFVK
jgi:hypothetical protein